MKNEKLAIGTKIYNYCYGPMTVVASYEMPKGKPDEGTIYCCTVDDINGTTEKIRKFYEDSPEQNNDSYLPDVNGRRYIKVHEDTIGHWFSLSRANATNIDNNFDFAKRNNLKVVFDDEELHAQFAGKVSKTNVDGSDIGNRAAANAEGSDIGNRAGGNSDGSDIGSRNSGDNDGSDIGRR